MARNMVLQNLQTYEWINKALADKDECKNRILSNNVRMSIDTSVTGLNNNMLVIGGSGAGKTFLL